MKKIDWTGQKFYKLTFIKSTNKLRGSGNSHGGTIWEAKCDCGNIFYCEPQRARDGKVKSCGCWRKEVSSKGVIRKYDQIISSAKYVWQRGYKDCDFELFFKLSQEKCFYCGRKPYRTYNVYSTRKDGRSSIFQKENGDFTYNGLDRIDSNKGHTEDNIVTCCTQCNKAKLDLSLSEFIRMIELIYQNTRDLPQLSCSE